MGTTYASNISGGYSTGPTSYAVAGGNASYVKPIVKSAVLGASTGPSSGGAVPTSNNNPVPTNNGGGGAPSIDVNEAYAPLLAALDSYAGTLNEGYGRDTGNINDQYVSGGKKVDTESAQLNSSVDANQSQYNNSLTSAYQDAIRAYNALAQQGNARFGGASSAGQAMGELANQEFFRQQGNINQQQASGDLQFAQEKTKVRDYITGKKDDLDNWKTQALGQLKSNLDTALSQIQQQKGVAEANKTKDRLAILQAAQQTADNIHMADVQFRKDLVSNAISSLQNTLGRALTLEEINTISNEYQNALIPSSGNLNSQAASTNPALKNVANTSDQFSSLVTPPISG